MPAVWHVAETVAVVSPIATYTSSSVANTAVVPRLVTLVPAGISTAEDWASEMVNWICTVAGEGWGRVFW